MRVGQLCDPLSLLLTPESRAGHASESASASRRASGSDLNGGGDNARDGNGESGGHGQGGGLNPNLGGRKFSIQSLFMGRRERSVSLVPSFGGLLQHHINPLKSDPSSNNNRPSPTLSPTFPSNTHSAPAGSIHEVNQHQSGQPATSQNTRRQSVIGGTSLFFRTLINGSSKRSYSAKDSETKTTVEKTQALEPSVYRPNSVGKLSTAAGATGGARKKCYETTAHYSAAQRTPRVALSSHQHALHQDRRRRLHHQPTLDSVVSVSGESGEVMGMSKAEASCLSPGFGNVSSAPASTSNSPPDLRLTTIDGWIHAQEDGLDSPYTITQKNCLDSLGINFRQERVDRTLHNKSPGTSAEGFCLWAESELRSQKFKNCFKINL